MSRTIRGTYTIAFAPYAVLTASVLRAATVTKRTPEEGAFVLDADRETATTSGNRDDGAARTRPRVVTCRSPENYKFS